MQHFNHQAGTCRAERTETEDGSKTLLASLHMFHGKALELPVRLALLDVVALVKLRFPLTHTQQNFDLPVFPIEGQGENGMPPLTGVALQLQDLALVQQKLTNRLGNVIDPIAEQILIDVSIVEIGLSSFNPDKSVADLRLPRPKRFDLGAMQHDSGLVGVQDVVIATGLGIGDNITHKNRLYRQDIACEGLHDSKI